MARAVLALSLGLASLMQGAVAHAFQVRPVRVDLSARQAAAQLVVTNPTDRPLLIQAQSWEWSQEGGTDRLGPTADLIVNPPIFEIAPGARQVVRVGLRQGLVAGQERSWRLWLSQVATPAGADDGGVQMLLRVSLPVFGAGEGLAGPAPHWQRDDDGHDLSLINGGPRHVHVRSLRLSAEGLPDLVLGPCYALPQSRCRWTLPPAWRAQAMALDADSDAGRLQGRLDATPAR